MRLFVRGRPSVVTMDDFLPFMYGNLDFAKRPGNGDFWGVFLEKAFARLNGNYENIGGGWQAEAWRILNGAPSRFYMMTDISSNANTAWSLISDANNQKFQIGADTGSNPPYGLVGGHAHTVNGYYYLKDASGKVQYRLLRIRNPWGSDSFTGPWNDNDSRWTAAYKAQVPYSNSNDGYFFMDVNDFVISFYYFQINYYRDDWKLSYYDRQSDDGSLHTYTFTLRTTQDVYLGADFYDPRMYANGCRGSAQTYGNYQLYRGNTQIDSYRFADTVGYGWTFYSGLSAGTYTLKFQAQWTSQDVKDFTVNVYAANTVFIYDENGKTSQDYSGDLQVFLYKAL